ncbi:MAG: type II toxin-antitoxin system Y4mF family antitoxin [Alphaproteobacteria bacterium]|nr:type II toxin-antitoxin system Y4mF family antitoxin [Alphaproteobacteria bacterium]
MSPGELGEIVRTARRALGLRQDQLAGAAGVGVRFIVDLESGKATAQLGKVLTVLATLGCRVVIEPPAGPNGISGTRPSDMTRTS